MSTNDTSSFIDYREREGFTSTEARRLQSSILMSLPSCDDSDNQLLVTIKLPMTHMNHQTICMISDVSIAEMKSDNLLFL